MGYNHRAGGSSRAVKAGMLLVCAAAMGVSISACGPLASQLEEQASASESAVALGGQPEPEVVMASPTLAPTPEPTPSAVEPAPRFTLAANQANMATEVQEACAELLARTGKPIPPAEVGECIGQSMRSAGTYLAGIETDGTALPGGAHHAEVRTAPDFAMLATSEAGTKLYVGGSGGYLTGRNGTADIDPDGGPDERSAAIIAEAARTLLEPASLKKLLANADSVKVDYAPETSTAQNAAVRLTGFGVDPIQGVETVSLELLLDPLYRPIRLDIIGTAQSIPATTAVTYSGWGTSVGIDPVP